jgi:hypothetical protein
VAETKQQMNQALSDVSAQQCRDIIRHTHDLMDVFLSSEEAGSLQKCGSMEELMKLSEKEREKFSDLDVPDSKIVGDAADEGELKSEPRWVMEEIVKPKRKRRSAASKKKAKGRARAC